MNYNFRPSNFVLNALWLGAFLVVAPVASVFAQDAAQATPMVEVAVKKGQIQTQPTIPPEDIRVRYEGVFHAKPIPVKPVLDAKNDSLDNLIARMIEMNSSGDPVKMAGLFMPDERAVVMDSYQDPKLLKPNMQFFRQVRSAAIDGYIVHKNVVYQLVAFEGADSKKLVVPTVRTAQGYYLTNKLANLSTLAELAAAYPAGQVKQATFNE